MQEEVSCVICRVSVLQMQQHVYVAYGHQPPSVLMSCWFTQPFERFRMNEDSYERGSGGTAGAPTA